MNELPPQQATGYCVSDFHNLNEASFGEFNPITYENLCNLRNLRIKIAVVGNSARQTGWMCKCGEKLDNNFICTRCRKEYKKGKDDLEEK